MRNNDLLSYEVPELQELDLVGLLVRGEVNPSKSGELVGSVGLYDDEEDRGIRRD